MKQNKIYLVKAVLLALCGILIGLSLISYSSFDPSFNRTTDEQVQNTVGKLGAVLSDILIQSFGLASFIAVLILFSWSKAAFLRRNSKNIFLRIAAAILLISLIAALLGKLNSPEIWPLYIGLGGITGDVFNQILQPLLGTIGFLIVIVTLAVSLVIYVFDINYALLLKEAVFKLRELRVNIYNAFSHQNKPKPVRNKKDESNEFIKSNLMEFISDRAETKLELAKPKTKKVLPPKQQKLKLANGDFTLPDYNLLMPTPDNSKKKSISPAYLEQNATLLKRVLSDFGVEGKITCVRPGPVVTLYELEPSPGTKSSRVIGLADDIARSMSSLSARISVIPGRNVLGIELPNDDRETVYLRELLETEEYLDKRIKIPIALGKDISGEAIMADMSRMPHLLVAGTTGSGKSVAINAMILSLIYRLTPDECKFIMIDPKMLELSVYEGIPHLLSPVVTEPQKAVVALKWAVKEMEERYRSMSNLGVRNIAGYNKRIEDAILNNEILERQVQTGFDPGSGDPIFETQQIKNEKIPFIVIIVDEMADLMLTAGKEIESSIQRLAQMARAAGIHIIMATQRPSVDVITGVIKANFPTRISFQVTSRIDSRTILGEMGAEQLLGMGDMLYMAGGTRITRVHGPFVDDKEVEAVVNHLKSQGAPAYIEDITKEDESATGVGGLQNEGSDELYQEAVAIILRDKKVSTSYIQRQLKIGYNRAANIIERMEAENVISKANHAGKREILIS